MGDFALRAVLVGLVALVVAIAVAVLRRRDVGRRSIRHSGLDPGIYLFTSASCLECRPAREALVARLGADGFVEFAWGRDREVFERLSVEEVPCALVVDESGSALLWPGQPDRMFSVVDP